MGDWRNQFGSAANLFCLFVCFLIRSLEIRRLSARRKSVNGKEGTLPLMPHVLACHAPCVVSDPFPVCRFLESFQRCKRPGRVAASWIGSFEPRCLHTKLEPAKTDGNAAIEDTRGFLPMQSDKYRSWVTK